MNVGDRAYMTYQPNIAYWSATSNPCGHHCREVPDISANAGVGMVIYANGAWTAVSGTQLTFRTSR